VSALSHAKRDTLDAQLRTIIANKEQLHKESGRPRANQNVNLARV
jgi:hypothetical protein